MQILKTSMAALAIAALAVTTTMGADTDFSGTWKLNPELSDAGGGAGGGGGGARGRGGRGGRGGGTPAEMTVSQTEDSITVSGGRTELVYKPGAGPEELSGGRMSGTQEARWDGDSLVIERLLNTPRGDFKVTSRWTLSDDGQMLTQEITNDMGGSPTTRKVVYEKQ